MPTRWLHRLRRVAALPPAERRALLRAQGALLHAQLRVWATPPGGLVRPRAAAAPAAPLPPEASRADGLARTVDRVAEGGLFRPTCLVRALALHRLLEGAGLRGSHIRIGVRRGAAFGAHAWVEFRGAALGEDGRRAAGFLPLAHGAFAPGAEEGR